MRAQLLILFVCAGALLWAQGTQAPRERRGVADPDSYRAAPVNPAPGPRTIAQPATYGTPPFSDYIIGPEDLIAISVLEAPEFSRPARVSTNGTIRLPLMKLEIQASGKTAGALEKDITRALIEEGLLRDPSVSVVVQEFNSKPVTVTGAVRTPTIIQAARPVTLLEAISRAGGLAENAGTEILISKPGKDGQEGTTIRVPAKTLLDGAEAAPEILLHGGEEVRVPVAARVYMLGGVTRPGALLINSEEPLTVLRAVSLSGGLLQTVGSRAFLLRTIRPSGEKKEIALNLHKIIKHQEPDFLLQANDVIFVPDSSSKKLKEAGAAGAIQTLMYSVAGALIWR